MTAMTIKRYFIEGAAFGLSWPLPPLSATLHNAR